MEIEENESQKLVTNILMELCNQVLEVEHCHRNVCTENNGNKLFFYEEEITKCVHETLFYIVEQCSLVPNQELTVKSEDSNSQSTYNILADEDMKESKCSESMCHQSAMITQDEKAQKTSCEHLHYVSGIKEDIKHHSQMTEYLALDTDCTDSEQTAPKHNTVPCKIDEVFVQENWCVEDEFVFDKEGNLSENNLYQNIGEGHIDVKEGDKEAQFDEQVQDAIYADMEAVDQTIVPDQEDSAIQLYQKAKPHKLDERIKNFEIQVTMQTHLDEEQKDLRDKTIEKKLNIQETVHDHSLEQSVKLCHLPKQNEADDQKSEKELAQTVDQALQQHMAKYHLCKQGASQGKPFKHDRVLEQSVEQMDMISHETLQEQTSQQSVEQDPFKETLGLELKNDNEQSVDQNQIFILKESQETPKHISCGQFIEHDHTSQQILLQDQKFESCVEQNREHQKIPLPGWTFEQSFEQNQAESEETLVPDYTSEASLDQNKTSILNEIQDQTPEAPIKRKGILMLNEIQLGDQTCGQSAKHDQAYSQTIVINQVSKQCDVKEQPFQQIVHRQKSVQSVEIDHASQEVVLPEQTLEQSVEDKEKQDSLQNETPGQMPVASVEATVELDKTSQQNVVQDQLSKHCVAQNQTPKETVQDQTIEPLKPHEDKTCWGMVEDQISQPDKTLTPGQPVEQDQTSQEIAVPAQIEENEAFDQAHEQTVKQDQTFKENLANYQIIMEQSVELNQISKNNFVQTSKMNLDQITTENIQGMIVEKMQGPISENTLLQDQISSQSIVQEQIMEQDVLLEQKSETTAMQVGGKSESFKDQTFDGVMQEQVLQESVHLENNMKQANLHDNYAEKTTSQKATFEEEEDDCEQIVQQNSKNQKFNEHNISASQTFKQFNNSDEQFSKEDQATIKQNAVKIDKTLNAESDCQKVPIEKMIEGNELVTSHENSMEKDIGSSPMSATNQRMISHYQQLQYCSEENPSCRPKRNFVAAEDTKFPKEESDMKRLCVGLQCSSSMEDQAVPSVETTEHFLPQEEACIYNCYGASKPCKKETFGANEASTNISVLDPEYTEKPKIQNECNFPDQEMPSREGGVFKWKYVPSFETDTCAPKKDDQQDGCVELIRVVSLPICRKPRRLGLSKKQKIQHLHPKFHPQ